jgi:hypothetical protein
MSYYAGLDVSLEMTSICIVDANGEVLFEGKASSEPSAVIGFLRAMGLRMERVGLEAGALSEWLAVRIVQRQGGKCAKVALARKIACVLHRMWVDGSEFRWGVAKAAA